MLNETSISFNSLPKEPAPKRKFIIWLIVFLVIAVVAGLGFLGRKLYQKSQWQAYNNAKYGYSLNYPKNWFIDSGKAQEDFANDVGGELVLSNYSLDFLKQLQFEDLPDDLTSVLVDIYKINAATTVDEFILEKIGRVPKTDFSAKDVTFAGLSGKQLIYIISGGEKEILYIQTILKKDDNILVITWNTFKSREDKASQEAVVLHDGILKSFQVK